MGYQNTHIFQSCTHQQLMRDDFVFFAFNLCVDGNNACEYIELLWL